MEMRRLGSSQGSSRGGACAEKGATCSSGVGSKRRPFGGPRPNWRRLFTTLARMAMTPWVREEAWALLHGSVWWAADRRGWAPMECGCAYCWRSARRNVDETATHFAVCPFYDRLWKAVEVMMDVVTVVRPVRPGVCRLPANPVRDGGLDLGCSGGGNAAGAAWESARGK